MTTAMTPSVLDIIRTAAQLVGFIGVCALCWSLRATVKVESPGRWRFVVWTLGVAGVLVVATTIGEVFTWIVPAT